MREWRPLHRGIITSDKLANVGDSAFRLFAYLISAQDDDGVYPWSRTKRRVLTVGTTWSDAETVEFGDELIAAGLCVVEDGMLQIVNGVEMQGKRRSDVKTFRYERDVTATSTTRARHVNDSGTLQNSREHNSREHPTPHTPAWARTLARLTAPKPLKPDRVEALCAWTKERGFSEQHLERTADALAGKWPGTGKAKYRDVERTFRSWVNRPEGSNGHTGERTGAVRRGPDRPEQAGDDRLAAY